MYNHFQYVEISFLQNLTGGDVTVMTEILNLFKNEVPKYLHDLKYSLEKEKWDDLAAVAHKAKSSFALMGIGDIVTDLKDLEILARTKQYSDNYFNIIQKVEEIYGKAIIELDTYILKASAN